MVSSKVWVKRNGEWEPGRESSDPRGGITGQEDHKTVCLEVDAEGSDAEADSVEKLLIHIDDVMPRNDDATVQEDLIQLMHLNEPCILHQLELRFMENSDIYTWCGPILLAVNPYERLPLYTDEIVAEYMEHSTDGMGTVARRYGGDQPPHVYAIAAAAFRDLVSGNTVRRNQSILISGESGAGKTETTKFAMRFLATVSQRDTSLAALSPEVNNSIETKVLESNPILEAFGNAKTIRNDNSSRFGKFIQLYFDVDSQQLIGATIATYLLEKIRLLDHAVAERSFHIFYQLLSAEFSDSERDRRGLNKNHAFALVHNARAAQSDAAGFSKTCKAMSVLGFLSSEIEHVFDLVAAVLHLGDLKFIEDGDSVTAGPSNVFDLLNNLLGLQRDTLMLALRTRVMDTKGEVFRVSLSVADVSNGRNALIKAVYASCFRWVVRRINEMLSSGPPSQTFIGILDIFGFETLEKNSLEQLCINYANERLQQVFNAFVLVNEQELYKAEKIRWVPIEFNSNEAIVSLLEGTPRKLGVFRLVDDECRLPNGTDGGFARKLYAAAFDAQTRSRFFATEKDKSSLRFGIHHYAGKVSYATSGFCSKNRDALRQELVDMLQESSIPFFREMFSTLSNDAVTRGSKGKSATSRISSIRTLSVVSQFQAQLRSLVDTINSTCPHFIRCFKSNDKAKPKQIHRRRLADQLRCAGVLEAVRVARQGFPVRLTLKQFFEDYQVLCPRDFRSPQLTEQNMRKTAKAVVESLSLGQDDCQVGRTKVFMRHEVYRDLLGKLDELRDRSSSRIQAFFRCKFQQQSYRKLLRTVVYLQSLCRMKLAMLLKHQVLAERCAIVIQRVLRGKVQQLAFRRLKRAVLLTQSLLRRRMALKRSHELRELKAALDIQRVFRGSKWQRWFALERKRVVLIQCRWRIKLAIRLRKQYYRDANDVNALKVALEKAREQLAAKENSPDRSNLRVNLHILLAFRSIFASGVAQYLLNKREDTPKSRESFGDQWYASTFSEELKQLEEATLASPLYRQSGTGNEQSRNSLTSFASSPGRCIVGNDHLKGAARLNLHMEKLRWKAEQRAMRRGMKRWIKVFQQRSGRAEDCIHLARASRKQSIQQEMRTFYAWKLYSVKQRAEARLAERWTAVSASRRKRRCLHSWAVMAQRQGRLKSLLVSLPTLQEKRMKGEALASWTNNKDMLTPSRKKAASSPSSNDDSPLFRTVLMDPIPTQPCQDEEFFDTENMHVRGKASTASEKIFVAIEERSLCGVEQHVSQFPGSINVRDSVEANTPLGFACNMGDTCLDIVEFLLEQGAMVNTVNGKGRTPIHMAAGSGGQKVVERLLDRGGNAWMKDKLGWTGKRHK